MPAESDFGPTVDEKSQKYKQELKTADTYKTRKRRGASRRLTIVA